MSLRFVHSSTKLIKKCNLFGQNAGLNWRFSLGTFLNKSNGEILRLKSARI